MEAHVTHGQLALTDAGVERLRLPLAAPVNDLLGLARTDAGYKPWLAERYRELGARPVATERVLHAFMRAARKAGKGQLAVELAPYVERLRFLRGGAVEVADFAGLAALSFMELLRRQAVELRTCPSCRAPWLGAPDDSPYCHRVAPGQGRSCRVLASERRAASDEDYSVYRRWYRRQNEAYRRGTLSATEWSALKAKLARMSTTERLAFALAQPERAKYRPTLQDLARLLASEPEPPPAEADLIRLLTSEPKPKPRKAPTKGARKEK